MGKLWGGIQGKYRDNGGKYRGILGQHKKHVSFPILPYPFPKQGKCKEVIGYISLSCPIPFLNKGGIIGKI